jgi:hypothetical protein
VRVLNGDIVLKMQMFVSHYLSLRVPH